MDAAITDQISRVVEYLIYAVLIYFAFRIGKHGLEDKTELSVNDLYKRLAVGSLIIIGIALFAAFSLGSPSCEETDYTGCVSYADDGYNPLPQERVGTLVFISLLFGIPYLSGGYSKHGYISSGKAASDERFRVMRKQIEDEEFNREFKKRQEEWHKKRKERETNHQA